MKTYDMQQRTLDWYKVKVGKFSASSASDLMTPKGEISKSQSAKELSFKKAGEILAGELQDTGPSTYAMRRGIDMEPEAFDFHVMSEGIEHTYVGFIEDDAGNMGVSPDALLGDDGVLELKCPLRHTHVAYGMDHQKLISQYYAQVQMQMLVCERDWTHLMSYDPKLQPIILRIGRDDDYIKKLSSALDAAIELRDEIVQELRGRGW